MFALTLRLKKSQTSQTASTVYLQFMKKKITQQEDAQQRSVQEFTADIKELHSRITTNTKEMTALMTQQHKEQKDVIDRLKDEVSNRVGVLEKWRWIIIGGSIVLGFIIQKLPVWP